jgi:hypothetical protein
MHEERVGPKPVADGSAGATTLASSSRHLITLTSQSPPVDPCNDSGVSEGATEALRRGSPALLRAGLLQMLGAGRSQWSADAHELAVALAPYYDCALRLGLDPTPLFDQAAEAGPPEVRDAVRDFGRRQDVRPGAFGYVLAETPDGPRYDRT